jgi:hypothetical protein
MRTVSLTALLVLAAFVLGLALGGAPREASAATSVAGIEWTFSSGYLILTNWTKDVGFLALGAFRAGSTQPAPPLRTDGKLVLSAGAVDKITVFQLEPVALCDSISCRPCNPGPFDCPIPPRPPIGATGVETAITPP